MKTAIIGSRSLEISDLEEYLPDGTTEIISGGAKGIDSCAERTAQKLGMDITVIKPNYARFGRCAPLKRNDEIISLADIVVAIWDGKSKGTKYVIERCQKLGKTAIVHII